MSKRMRRGTVVVITGASSGIGRALALMLAKRRAHLVLAARSESSLVALAAECRTLGAEALVVPTDVAEESQVEALAARAAERFGHIDAWVGAASVYIYGAFEHVPSELFRRLVEVNLFGQVHSARAALPRLREQGGTLVFVGSIFSTVTAPYVAPYVTSKHALLGFAESLRQELHHEPRRHRVAVCTVLPSTIDTPIYQHAANVSGRRAHPMPPTVSPKRVAREIAQLLEKPRPVAVVGQTQRMTLPLQMLAPRAHDAVVGRMMRHVALRGPDGTVPASEGNVFEPQPELNRVEGGWSGRSRRRLKRQERARRRALSRRQNY